MEKSACRKLALVIGNESYSHPGNRLDHPLKNKDDLSKLLNYIGFKVAALSNCKKSEMLEGIQKFEEEIRKGDLVLFYYSGHARHFDENNYLIPIDDDEIKAERDLQSFAIQAERTLSRFVDKMPYATIFILDCCNFYKLSDEQNQNEKFANNGLQKIRKTKGALIQFACAATPTDSPILRGNENCLFAKHLLKHIAERNVDVAEVFNRIVRGVREESDYQQNPLTINGLEQLINVYLNDKPLIFIPDIPHKAKWKRKGQTVAGAHSSQNTLGRLNYPKSLYVNRNHAVFVADSLNHRIVKFNEHSQMAQRIAGKNINGYALDRLNEPTTAIFDIFSKSFIICDYGNRRVLKRYYKPRPTIEVVIDNIACFGAAIDNEGLLYISDVEHHEVKRYDLKKRCVTIVAGGNGQGRRRHQLNNPTYICVGLDQSVYVSDSWNDRVMKWEKGAREGIVVAGGHGKGGNRTQLDSPAGIAVDRSGSIYVADHSNNRVVRWHNGAVCGDVVVGGIVPGDGDDQLSGPEGLAFDRSNSLYVADSNNHRVQRFHVVGLCTLLISSFKNI